MVLQNRTCSYRCSALSLDERPTFQSLHYKVHRRCQRFVSVSLTSLRAALVQVSIQPQPELTTENECMWIYVLCIKQMCIHTRQLQWTNFHYCPWGSKGFPRSNWILGIREWSGKVKIRQCHRNDHWLLMHRMLAHQIPTKHTRQ